MLERLGVQNEWRDKSKLAFAKLQKMLDPTFKFEFADPASAGSDGPAPPPPPAPDPADRARRRARAGAPRFATPRTRLRRSPGQSARFSSKTRHATRRVSRRPGKKLASRLIVA